MFVAVSKYLIDILEEHFEETAILWERRRSAVSDPLYSVIAIGRLDERMEAHVDGLILGEQHARPILEEGIGGDEASVIFAAAYVLLRLQDQAAADLVMDTLMEAQDEQVDGLRQALSQGPLDLVGERLKEMYQSGPSRLAVVAAEVFASHGRLHVTASRLRKFYDDDDPEIRQAAWRITALVGMEITSQIDVTNSCARY
jgi:HEAT repeat protein